MVDVLRDFFIGKTCKAVVVCDPAAYSPQAIPAFQGSAERILPDEDQGENIFRVAVKISEDAQVCKDIGSEILGLVYGKDKGPVPGVIIIDGPFQIGAKSLLFPEGSSRRVVMMSR